MKTATLIRTCGLSAMTISSVVLASTPANSIQGGLGFAGVTGLTVALLAVICWQIRLFHEIVTC